MQCIYGTRVQGDHGRIAHIVIVAPGGHDITFGHCENPR